MQSRRLYVVRGVSQRGSTTYRCPTADWALRKSRDLQAAGLQDITIIDPDGALITEADLIGAMDGSGAAPAEEALPAAPKITRRPALA
jgi:hypothetical protein